MNRVGNTIEQLGWDEMTLGQQTQAFEAFCRQPSSLCDHAIALEDDCEFCEIEYLKLSQPWSAIARSAA